MFASNLCTHLVSRYIFLEVAILNTSGDPVATSSYGEGKIVYPLPGKRCFTFSLCVVLQFLQNQGFLIGVTTENEIQVLVLFRVYQNFLCSLMFRRLGIIFLHSDLIIIFIH